MSWSDKELTTCFRMPSGSAITGRTTSIRNVFVAAIVPLVRPTPDEIRQVLEILNLNPFDLRCAYCGDKATEWDHLKPLVKAGRPTGYPSSIRNLVPACGKCNQSKGSTNWREWMLGKARHSPSARAISDISGRIDRLEAFESWSKCVPLDLEKLVSPHLWTKYYAVQDEIISKLREAQKLALEIASEIRSQAAR